LVDGSEALAKQATPASQEESTRRFTRPGLLEKARSVRTKGQPNVKSAGSNYVGEARPNAVVKSECGEGGETRF